MQAGRQAETYITNRTELQTVETKTNTGTDTGTEAETDTNIDK